MIVVNKADSGFVKVIFAVLLQTVMGGLSLFVPMFWISWSSLALILGVIGFVAMLGATGWFVTGLVADKTNLENMLLITFLIALFDLAVAVIAVVLMAMIFGLTVILLAL